MKKYDIVNDQKGGIKAVESSTGHWMLASEVERMQDDGRSDLFRVPFDTAYCEEEETKGDDNGN